MSTGTGNSNNSPPSQPGERKVEEEFPAEEKAERRGVKRSQSWGRGEGGNDAAKLKMRKNSTEEVEHDEDLIHSWMELFYEEYKNKINPQEYGCESVEEVVSKLRENIPAAKKAEERVPPPGEDPTDELWAVPDNIQAEIAVWKREAGLPEKYERIHNCLGKSIERPDLDGCDFVRFSDNIYVCKATGIVHVCVGQPCSRATLVAPGDLVCTISAAAFPYVFDISAPTVLLLTKEEEDRRRREEEEEEERQWQQEEEENDENNWNPRDSSSSSSECPEGKSEKGEEDWCSDVEAEMLRVMDEYESDGGTNKWE